jgi:hypothetical protein
MEETHEQNEYRKNSKINLTSSKRTKINWMFSEELEGKYESVTSHVA